MRLPNMSHQQGFTLVTAIFILVIASVMSVFVISTTVTQQATSTYALQGARAYRAAQSGIQWGIRRVLEDNQWAVLCTGADNNFVVNDFNVSVICTFTQYTEGDFDFCVFQMASVATRGVFGSVDFVQRRLQLVLSENRLTKVSTCQ